MLTRRTLLRNTSTLATGLALAPSVRAFAAADPELALTRGSAPAISLPPDFMGLGYEMSSVATPGLLSARNERYTHLVQALGAQGVLRVGGIVADYTRYDPSGTSIAEPKNTVITRELLEQFNGFLQKIGWTAIWSVNFAQGSVEDAVTEARAVTEVLGPRLLAIEIGNEVENYARGAKPFRTPPYTYEAFRAEYTQWRSAILKAVPKARFAAPDTASSVEWVERMAQDANGEVQLLTTHYYRGNQRQGSAEQLQGPDPKLKSTLERLRKASVASGLPWRMCETNSFSGGGLPAVSNTFLGALWTLDFMLLLATGGCAGVNIETGVNQLGFVSSYSPIQDDGKGNNSAGLPFYGMLAFAVARQGCDQAMPIEIAGQGAAVTGYALGSGGKIRSVVLLNRGDSNVRTSVAALGLANPRSMSLQGPSLLSPTGVALGGAAVDGNGHWTPAESPRVNGASVLLPKTSALILRA